MRRLSLHLHVPICLLSGSLKLLKQSGLVQTCIGIALPLYTVTKGKGHPTGCSDGTGRGRLKSISLPYTTLVLVGTGGQRQTLTTLPQEIQPIPETAGWNSGSVWKGRKNYAPTGVGTPDLPMRWEVRVVNTLRTGDGDFRF